MLKEASNNAAGSVRNPEGLNVAQLRAAFSGQVIGPEDPGYDEARTVFYGGIDRRPAAIVRASGRRPRSHASSHWPAKPGWSWPSAAAATAWPATASPMGASCSTSRTCARSRSMPKDAPPGPRRA